MISEFCVAGKLAFVLTTAWLYLPLARATGELWEYMQGSRERQPSGERFTDEEWAGVTSPDPREWLRGLLSYTQRWVKLNHRIVDELTDHRCGSGRTFPDGLTVGLKFRLQVHLPSIWTHGS
jgi:hypothetical protein